MRQITKEANEVHNNVRDNNGYKERGGLDVYIERKKK